jgi:hypothetical protein
MLGGENYAFGDFAGRRFPYGIPLIKPDPPSRVRKSAKTRPNRLGPVQVLNMPQIYHVIRQGVKRRSPPGWKIAFFIPFEVQ